MELAAAAVPVLACERGEVESAPSFVRLKLCAHECVPCPPRPSHLADAEEDAAVDALNDETFGDMGGDVSPLPPPRTFRRANAT